MAHNSFDIVEVAIDSYTCASHNFKECVGVGTTKDAAFNDMYNQLIYLKNNNLPAYKANIKLRLKKGLECMCGFKLEGEPVGVI